MSSFPTLQLFSVTHTGNFAPGGESGTIQKKSDDNERNALKALMEDRLRPYVPEFRREVEKDGISILCARAHSRYSWHLAVLLLATSGCGQ